MSKPKKRWIEMTSEELAEATRQHPKIDHYRSDELVPLIGDVIEYTNKLIRQLPD